MARHSSKRNNARLVLALVAFFFLLSFLFLSLSFLSKALLPSSSYVHLMPLFIPNDDKRFALASNSVMTQHQLSSIDLYSGVSNFVYFYCYNALRLRATTLMGVEQLTTQGDLAIAFLAGVINVLATSPMWVASNRLKVQSKVMKCTHTHTHTRRFWWGRNLLDRCACSPRKGQRNTDTPTFLTDFLSRVRSTLPFSC